MLGIVTADLSLVVVHHRVPDVLAECLGRIVRFAPEAQVVVVDTAPDAAVDARVRALTPRARIVHAPNHSLAHAVNLGVRATSTPLVAHMNADVYLEPDTLARLASALHRTPHAGLAGPLPLAAGGRPQDLGPAYALHYLRLRAQARRRPGAAIRVPWLAGCLQLVRREVFATCGGLDASLRFYNEDLDFCLRARRAGYRCLLVDAPVVHLGGSSTPDDGAFLVEGVRGGLQLSRRYQPPVVRALHRGALLAWGAFAERWARTPGRRATAHRIGSMVRGRTEDTSPFGATLDVREYPSEPRP